MQGLECLLINQRLDKTYTAYDNVGNTYALQPIQYTNSRIYKEKGNNNVSPSKNQIIT